MQNHAVFQLKFFCSKEFDLPVKTGALDMMPASHGGGGTPIVLVSRRKKEDESRREVGSSCPINK